MPRKPAPQPRGRESDRELSSLGGRRKVRLGIASKFTVPVALTTTLIIVVMGFVIQGTASDALEAQLNRQGVFAARLAATPEIDTWREEHATVAYMQRKLVRISAALAVAGATGGGEAQEGTELAALQEQIASSDEKQRAANRDRLARLTPDEKNLAKGALDFWILDAEGRSIARASRGDSVRWRGTSTFAIAASPKTAIKKGTYQVDGESHYARFFEHPILSAGGKRVGAAVVIFSEKELRAGLAALESQVFGFCIAGILISTLVALLVAKVVTRPLDHLMHDIETVADGKLSHRTRARSNDEIGALATTFDRMTRNLEAAESMRQDLVQKEHEVELATEVQERLFPRDLPRVGQLDLVSDNRLVGELSADLFDTISLGDDRVGVLVMSASGSGVPAAIVLSMARSLFRALAPGLEDPADVLRAINRELAPDLKRGMYVSAIYAILDGKTGEARLASAGHRVPALHFDAASNGLRRHQSDGIAMGLDKGPVFDGALNAKSFTLGAGDRLVLASEGAFLLVADGGEVIEDQTFLKAVLAVCREGLPLERLLPWLEGQRGLTPGDRDVTLVEARMAAGG